MTKWATINRQSIETDIAGLDKQIEVLTGYHPEKLQPKHKFDLQTMVVVARLMGTRDALVSVFNATSGGDG